MGHRQGGPHLMHCVLWRFFLTPICLLPVRAEVWGSASREIKSISDSPGEPSWGVVLLLLRIHMRCQPTRPGEATLAAVCTLAAVHTTGSCLGGPFRKSMTHFSDRVPGAVPPFSEFSPLAIDRCIMLKEHFGNERNVNRRKKCCN